MTGLTDIEEYERMQGFPHNYIVSANAKEDSQVSIASPGLEELTTAPPAEFGGPGDRWSPESLLTAAVASCFILSFRAIARASKYPWTELTCEVDGTLDRVEGKPKFTSFSLKAHLAIDAGVDVAKGEKLLHKAEQACLITNSLSASNELSAIVSEL